MKLAVSLRRSLASIRKAGDVAAPLWYSSLLVYSSSLLSEWQSFNMKLCILHCHRGWEVVCLIMLFKEMHTFHVWLHYRNMPKLLFAQQQGRTTFPALLQHQHITLGRTNTCRAFCRAQGILSRIFYLGSVSRCWSPSPSCPHHPPGTSFRMPRGTKLFSFNLMANSPKRDNFLF